MQQKIHCFIDNKEYLCDSCSLYPMIAREGKYIPGGVHNQMKGILINYWKDKSLLGLYSIETFIIPLIIGY